MLTNSTDTRQFTGALVLTADATKEALAYLARHTALGMYSEERAYLVCDAKRIKLELAHEAEDRRGLRRTRALTLYFEVDPFHQERACLWSHTPYGGYVALLATALQDLLRRVQKLPETRLYLGITPCRYSNSEMFDETRGLPSAYSLSAGDKCYAFEAYAPVTRYHWTPQPGHLGTDPSAVTERLRGLDGQEALVARTVLTPE